MASLIKYCTVKHEDGTECSSIDGHDRLKYEGDLFDHANIGEGVYWNVDVQGEHDPVNHPKHYTSHPSGIECIQIVRHMSFNVGNAVKYCWRAGKKGPEIEDLEKAVWYLNDEIARLKNAGS